MRRQREPDTTVAAEPGSERDDSAVNGTATAVAAQRAAMGATLRQKAAALPVSGCRDAVVNLIKRHRAVVIVAETGSGKTTQIPQFIVDDIVGPAQLAASAASADSASDRRAKASGGSHQQHQQLPLLVGVTQPRRVAAVSVAQYVARCRGVAVGDEVGYSVRFDEQVSPQRTRLKFMTDGMLLRELLVDPALSRYACIVLDEAHERTLNGDVLFGLLKRLFTTRRRDLRIVVMSATLDSDAFSRFWNGAPIGFVGGRTFPVDVFYATEPQADYVDAALTTIAQIHLQEPRDAGDILCFLTGQDEIEDARRALEERRRFLPPTAASYVVVPLYAAMSPAQQMAAFEPAPAGSRKIVLATNIAETSVTIEGVVFVVDTGLVKARQFDAQSGLETLQVVVGSRAQTRQRAGRAGRTRPGKCYRLFTEEAFETSMADQTTPEMLRCSLSSVVLQMKSLGIDDVVGFDFMDRPSEATLLRALEELAALRAVDEETGAITALGRALVTFPVEPMEARAIVRGAELGCSDEVCVILAMMAVDEAGLFDNNSGAGGGGAGRERAADASRASFAKTLGDHLTLLSVYEAYSRQRPGAEQAQWCAANGVSPKQIKKATDIEVQLRTHCARRESATNAAEPGLRAASAVIVPGGGSQAGFVPPYRAGERLRAEAAVEYPSIRRAFTAGFFLHAAYFDPRQRNYVTAVGRDVAHVHPRSVLHAVRRKPALVVFHAVLHTQRAYMRDVLAIRDEWLFEEAPGVFARPTSSAG
jgi:HrpA-like RNA helicase